MPEQKTHFKIGEIADRLAKATGESESYIAAALRRWQQANLIVPVGTDGSGVTKANLFAEDQVYRARLLLALLKFDFSIPRLKEFMSRLDEERTAVSSKRSTGVRAGFSNVLGHCLKAFNAGSVENLNWILQITAMRSDGDFPGTEKGQISYTGKFHNGLDDQQRETWTARTVTINGERVTAWNSSIESLIIVHLPSIWLSLYRVLQGEGD